MYRRSVINQALFKRDSTLGVRVMVLIFLACLLMFADHHNKRFHAIRSQLSMITIPLQYFVHVPITVFNWTLDAFSMRETLLRENTALQVELVLLNAKLQKQFVLKTENKQLRELLESSAAIEDKVSVAQLLSVSTDPFIHQVILNRGKKDGIFVGQPVLDVGGVIGQVIEVEALTSRVLLITDFQSALPVQVKRNGVRAIAVGRGVLDVLQLQNVTDTTDLREGDVLITSGLGGRYPFGYPVGVIVSVQHDTGSAFLKVEVMPAAHLDRSRLVLLVWPAQSAVHESLRLQKS